MKDFWIKILNLIKSITFHLSFTVTALVRWLSKKKRLNFDMTFDIEEEEEQRKEEIAYDDKDH